MSKFKPITSPMQHLPFQDILSIVGLILGPKVALLGVMWYYFNRQSDIGRKID